MEEVTVREASELLGTTVRRVHDLVNMGTLKARRATVKGRSVLSPLVMVDKESLDAYQRGRDALTVADRARIGMTARWSVTAEKREEMKEAGYMTAVEAGKEIGVTPYHLTNLVKTKKLPGKVEGIVWIHETDVMALKARRDTKIAEMMR
jgi:hypothetical protein